eukprot:TRINITY_DN2066_c0_g2_i2.p1 TRINITY_DN2066_c0_g2~~TRINITY_DN2066_c0_g2_i2.p1  ORF type:complete len:385 (-),score=75.60 TRINITY_DN2066_c0_g2_i2:55-1143(-)
MDRVENFEQLLDYVYTDEDISDSPSIKEYKKLTRVMKVMVRFYERGEAAKKAQHEDVVEEISKIELNLEMANKQLKSLESFPSFHPKRKEYENTIYQEIEELTKVRTKYQKQADGFNDLHEWGKKIVETMLWLEGNLKHYANQKLKTEFEVPPMQLTSEQFLIYKQGLAEVTYNLQESQDFFEASLDGRLRLYHELERDMIKTQLEILQEYPEDNPRRVHFETELSADLEFVMDNMEENPKVRNHRERMQQMHKDFFALLKWQRKKIQSILADEPLLIVGDVEKLKKDLEELANKQAARDTFQSKFGDREQERTSGCPLATKKEGGTCPVDHSAMVQAFTNLNVDEKKKQGFIHRLYEGDKP